MNNFQHSICKFILIGLPFIATSILIYYNTEYPINTLLFYSIVVLAVMANYAISNAFIDMLVAVSTGGVKKITLIAPSDGIYEIQQCYNTSNEQILYKNGCRVYKQGYYLGYIKYSINRIDNSMFCHKWTIRLSAKDEIKHFQHYLNGFIKIGS